MSGGVPTWTVPASSPITSVFGRNGLVTAQAGDYTTDQVTEGTNLYYTTTRFNTDFAARSTTNLTEGTNLYFTDARARAALSITGPLTYNSTTWVFGINQANTITNGFLSSADWNTFNSKENVLTFGTGLTRVGNSIWIGTLTGGMLSGFTTGQIVFGSPTGGLTQSGGLFWNNTNTRLGVGTSTPGYTLDVAGTLRSSRYLLDLDLSLIPIANDQSALTSWWGLQLIGNRQASVDYTPLTYWVRDDYGVLIPNQQADKVGLMVRGAVWQSGHLTRWENSAGTALSAIWSDGSLRIGTGSSTNLFHLYWNNPTVGLTNMLDTISGRIENVANGWTIGMKFMARNSVWALKQVNMGINPSFDGDNGVFWILNNGLADPIFMANLTTNNVWIGTTQPTARFHVWWGTGTNLMTITGTWWRNILRITQDTTDALDIQRVTLGQWGISASKPDSLARDQLYVFGRINTSWDMAWYDFLGGNVANLTVDTNLWNGIAFDPVSGATFSLPSVPGYSGIGRIALSAANTSVWFIWSAGSTPTERSLNPVFETRLAISNNGTVRVIAGFADRVLNANIGADTNNHTNQAFFRKTAGGTVWTAVTRNAWGAETITNLTSNPTVMSILRIELDDNAWAARFYIDWDLVATHNNASVPASGTRLGYHIGARNTAAAARNLDIDYIRVWSDDPPASSTQSDLLFSHSAFSAIDEKFSNTHASKWFLQEIDSLMDSLWGSFSLSGSLSFEEKGEYSSAEYLMYVLNFTKKSLEKMSGSKILSDLWIQTLRTDSLCIGDACYTNWDIITRDSIAAYIPQSTTINNYHTTTQIIDNTTTIVAESVQSEDTWSSVLEFFETILDTLFVRIKTVFNEMVTFMKSVTFQSDVTFQQRIIFEDRDMAGVAIIRAGANSVRVDFARPYASIPVVTVSADAFVTYRVTDKGVTGFTIETQNNVSSDTRFDWMALMVRGAWTTSSTNNSTNTDLVEITPTETTPEEVVEEAPVEEVVPPVVSETTEESTPEVTPEESVTEEVIEDTTTEEVIEEVATISEIPTESIVPEDAPTEPAPEAPTEASTVSDE